MPTYEYACEACGHRWEAEQSIKAEPLKECPACKKDFAKRQISQGNFILMGGCWSQEGYSR
jgi:putative FmdB family regulatory protein